MSNLRAVLQQLKSDKVTERRNGLAAIRETFSRDKAVSEFQITDGKSDPRVWLPVFQALFTTVLNEKIASIGKPTTKSAGPSVTAQRRLQEAASVVRWLTERTAHLMNKKIIKALFEHLVQTMVHRGELLHYVALDYLKALKCLVSHTMHLEHMEDEIWIRVVEIGFNIVLGDPIKSQFTEDVVPSEASEAEGPDDSDFYMDDTEDKPASTPTRKRKKPYGSIPSSKLPSPKKQRRTSRQISVSTEQVEVVSLLSLLLRSPTSPILSSDYQYLPAAILLRLQRFLDLYPADSSLLHDYLMILSFTLGHLSLNKKRETEAFARACWDKLVDLWGGKDKRVKECLIVVLRELFPYVITENDAKRVTQLPFHCADSIGRLWNLLIGEADSRWGVDGLSLASLRLEQEDMDDGAFIEKTFRAGSRFDANQALVWGILELQADCGGKLFQWSESMHSSSIHSGVKRVKMENPINGLLSSILSNSSNHVRCYHLQILLFFISRHWSILHNSIKQEVAASLIQLVSIDDGPIQSWIFLSFAAMAYAERSSMVTETPGGRAGSLDSATWDSIWTHAIRRTNVSGVCRAACHTAHILISTTQSTSAYQLLTPQRVLTEIESLAKDMDVQGPAHPYDSVCMFLAQCLKIASQDVRLYRMRLEDKVLSWLVDSWKVAGAEKDKMTLHALKDVMLLLEIICGFTRKSSMHSSIVLPKCQIADSMVEDGQTEVIRNFLLLAQLPKLCKPANKTKRNRDNQARSSNDITTNQMVPPGGREKKLSTFFLKSLEMLHSEWGLLSSTGHFAAKAARLSLDMAITALVFESTLTANGIIGNRYVIQSAAKLLSEIAPSLKDSRWTQSEKALIIQGLEPLIRYNSSSTDIDVRRWEAVLTAGAGSGIRTQSLKNLRNQVPEIDQQESAAKDRISFLKLIWQNADICDILSNIINILRDLLHITLGDTPIDSAGQHVIDVDERDGFGPIRTTTLLENMPHNTDPVSDRFVLRVCVEFLTVGPLLQSASGEPTRDKDLTELAIKCADTRPDNFFLVCPAVLDAVCRHILNITVNQLDSLLEAISRLSRSYAYAKSERLKLLTVRFLNSTQELWLSQPVITGDVGGKVKDICIWLSTALKKQKIRDWTTRDALACFFDQYLLRDPSQSAWPVEDDDDNDTGEDPDSFKPFALLAMMNSDSDIRVRFRIAALNARLFSVARRLQYPAMKVYAMIKEWHTIDLNSYEHMLTRILSLGNIMIVSSAVRRGPYWHLLETSLCDPSSTYSQHIEVVLTCVSQRLSLAAVADLFQAYASQIAFSVRKLQVNFPSADFLRFPPHLLGYQDRKQSAEASFRAFTPTNLLTGAHDLFESHCRIVQKTTADGIRECFGDIVGIQIVKWFDESADHPIIELEQSLIPFLPSHESFEVVISDNLDAVICSILRTLGEQDFTSDGHICHALLDLDPTGKVSQNFQALGQYRNFDNTEIHEPNLPAFPSEALIRGLSWIKSTLPGAITKATTYHVLQELFADLDRTPLINEQIRLLNGITMWIAMHSEHFEDLTLLYTLVHGATAFLTQIDLARSAQSILEWAFRIYRRMKAKEVRLPNILIRICCLSHDHASSIRDSAAANLGDNLLKWIDEQVVALSKVPVLTSMAQKALASWPHQPSSQLSISQLYNRISSEILSFTLSDNRITSNKFRLVRRLREQAISHGYDKTRFSKVDFWRLKACMPPEGELQDEDVEAFASLLLLNYGKIDSFGGEQPTSNSIRNRFCHRRKGSEEESTFARDCIIFGLLAMLEDDNASHVYTAYNTLRLILAVLPEDVSQALTWPAESRAELDYLQTYRQTPISRPSHDLRDLVSEHHIEAAQDFSAWISLITGLLSDILSVEEPIFAQLTSVLQNDVVFSEQMLPVIVQALLQREARSKSSDSSVRTSLSAYFTSILLADGTSTRCLRSIIDIVLHLRHFKNQTRDALAYNKWLDVDFLLLAQKAILCGAYTTALLFLELAAEFNAQAADSSEQVLYEIYAHIDEPDGFYGIQTKDLHQFLIKRFHHEKQWEKAFRFHGAALEAGHSRSSEAEGLMKSFHSFGFDHLAMETLQSPHGNGTNTSSSGMSYHLGWRTETWDLPEREEHTRGASLYQSLRAISCERNPAIVDSTIRHAMYDETNYLKTLGSENIAEIREVTQDLMCLSQILKWRAADVQTQLKSRNTDEKQWNDFVALDAGFEFSDLESIMATRISLIRSVRHQEERQQIGPLTTPFGRVLLEIEKRSLLNLSNAARDANEVQIALNSVIRAQQLEQTPSLATSQEFANVLWLQKEEKLAVQFLRSIIERDADSSSGVDITRKAELLARLGAWTSEACLEKPTDILTHYFQPSVAMLSQTLPGEETHATIYYECAIFAERQYHAILKSPDLIRWKVYMDRKKQEIQQRSIELAQPQPFTRQTKLERDQNTAQKILQEDSEIFQRHNLSRDAFLQQAIEMYSRCLEVSDTFDKDAAIRFCSLWFANFDDEVILPDSVEKALNRIPSRKLLFLAHQLTARLSKPLSNQTPKNQESLQRLILRMCQEHPFHSLYQVYCLRPDTGRSAESGRRQSGRHSTPSTPSTQTERRAAASDIFNRLKGEDIFGQRVRDMELLCNASIQWAKFPITKDKHYIHRPKKPPGFPIPDHLAISRLSNLKVPVSTCHTPIDPTMKYEDCVWLDHYDKSFSTVGGLNLPKITTCYGSDGLKYKQLFKGEGNDDLRQDAVMEQVFDLVNHVLSRDRETRRRNLKVRDYKVIPLDNQSGLLEFVGNSSQLREWLFVAHLKYRPMDTRFAVIQEKHKAVQKAYPNNAEKQLAVFLDLRKNFGPVMRHYFTEKHKTPMSWFYMRLNYTRSVATTSIVGHVLGLGDRHTSNILLDNITGEVIHIDLGIAFDQGKLLTVPERVPFRMTADMVDGMGISGTQGVFQRCAEETLRVLRERSGVIMTVLEVFKHDPLHSWTASELKVQQAQEAAPSTTNEASRLPTGIGIDMSSGTAEEAADRALTSVARKLDKSLSVESTVNELIAEATDPVNLATIFHGWAPHL